jgi:hypothetical protein
VVVGILELLLPGRNLVVLGTLAGLVVLVASEAASVVAAAVAASEEASKVMIVVASVEEVGAESATKIVAVSAVDKVVLIKGLHPPMLPVVQVVVLVGMAAQVLAVALATMTDEMAMEVVAQLVLAGAVVVVEVAGTVEIAA